MIKRLFFATFIYIASLIALFYANIIFPIETIAISLPIYLIASASIRIVWTDTQRLLLFYYPKIFYSRGLLGIGVNRIGFGFMREDDDE